VQEFDFEVRDNGKSGVVGEPIDKPVVHILQIPNPHRSKGRAPDPKIALLGM